VSRSKEVFAKAGRLRKKDRTKTFSLPSIRKGFFMDASHPSAPTYRFGNFEVDPCSGELRSSGHRVRLQEQPFQVLVALLAHPGEVLTREELRQHVWPAGTFVDFDHALNTAVKKIRCALEDHANVPRYVETIPRRGYRFIAPVETVAPPCTVNSVVLSRVECEPEGIRLRSAVVFRRPLLLAFATGVILMAALLGYLKSNSVRTHAAAEKRIMLVVLPFENMSGDESQAYLSDGLCEELTTQLGRLDPERLGVTARTTATNYRLTHASISDIGKDLSADYFIEGSVRRDAQRVRVTAQLIRVSDQTHLWADDFDHPLDNPLNLQTDVAKAITREVSARLLPAQERSSR
jgi:TolB-like protein/DNA-binding winged helix-turn-helix (wHTH) protein